MPQYTIQLAIPQSPVATNVGGFSVTFPFVVVPHEALGTPLQSASSTPGTITAKITGSLLAVWNIPHNAVLKIMSYVLRERIARHISDTGQLPTGATVELSTYNYPGPCPFDLALIDELPGSPVSVAINPPIGFIHGA